MTENGNQALATLREVSRGINRIEDALAGIATGDLTNAAFLAKAAFPLEGRDAQVYLQAKVGAYLQVLVACSHKKLERCLWEARTAPSDEGALLAQVGSIGKALEFLVRAQNTSVDSRRADVRANFAHLSDADVVLHVNSAAEAYWDALEMCDSTKVLGLVASLECPAEDGGRVQGPQKKGLRPLQPWASAQVAQAVLDQLAAGAKTTVARLDQAGCYVVGLSSKSGGPVVVVNGNFGRPEFLAAMAELAAYGIESPNALVVVARTATYSGGAIWFSKFDDLGIDVDGLTPAQAECQFGQRPASDVATESQPVADVTKHFGMPYGQQATLGELGRQVAAGLPGGDAYERGFKDALESLSMALSPKMAQPILAEALTTALNAYGNNADAGDGDGDGEDPHQGLRDRLR